MARIAGVDLPRNKQARIALTYIYGIGDPRSARILKAANQLCRPRVPEVYLAQFGVRDFSCAPMLLLTSLPAQREIGFRLDHTRYIARVVVTDDPPRLVDPAIVSIPK